MTTAEAVAFVGKIGFEGEWALESDTGVVPTCPASADCPIPGVPADASGCLSIGAGTLSPSSMGPDPRVDVYVGWWVDEWTNARYSISKRLSDLGAIQSRADDSCTEIMGGRPSDPPDLYGSIPFTEVVQPTYWNVMEPPAGDTLKLDVAVGGSCETFERLEVHESDESVTVDAFIRHSNPGPGGGCDDYLSHHAATVELEAPLGDRQLLGCAPPELWYVDDDRNCADLDAD